MRIGGAQDPSQQQQHIEKNKRHRDERAAWTQASSPAQSEMLVRHIQERTGSSIHQPFQQVNRDADVLWLLFQCALTRGLHPIPLRRKSC